MDIFLKVIDFLWGILDENRVVACTYAIYPTFKKQYVDFYVTYLLYRIFQNSLWEFLTAKYPELLGAIRTGNNSFTCVLQVKIIFREVVKFNCILRYQKDIYFIQAYR